MRLFKVGAAAVSVALSAVAPATMAQVPSGGQLIFGVERADGQTGFTPVQYFLGGRQYCFYPGGWHGPGWYWCGYAYRRGFGWGGGAGWHGWRGGGFHGGGFHGGPGGGSHGGGHGPGGDFHAGGVDHGGGHPGGGGGHEGGGAHGGEDHGHH
jgi:hypothetical protein